MNLPVATRVFPSLLLCALLSGCAMQSTSSPLPAAGVSMQGVVHGGQQAIVGAHVHLMAAASTGYGAAATSLLTIGTAGSDAYGGYTTTDANGNFVITGDYVCTPGTQAYVLATGGNPGLPAGQTNANLALMSAIGQCPATGTFVLTVPLIYVNEVTTVGSVYALSGFMTDLSHVASSGTPLGTQGLANAFANAKNLYGVSTGVALATTPGGNGQVPQSEINSLANIITPCVNSAGAASTACSTLFSNAGNGTTQPADTVTAALNIAHNPAANVGPLFGLQTASGAPFMPALSGAPNDFTLALAYSGGGINSPIAIAADGSGNIWTANAASLSSINGATGVPNSPSTGYTGNGLSNPFSIAIDAAGNAWAVDQLAVSKFTSTGAAAPGSPITGGGLSNPTNYGNGSAKDIAFDANGNAWVGNYYGTGTVTEINGTTAALMSGPTGFPVSTTNTNPNGVAIDSAGHVWISGYNNSQVYELSVATGANIFTGARNVGGLDVGVAVAIDAANNIWLPDNYDPNTLVGVTLTELTSTGAPAGGTPFGGGGLLDPLSVAIDGLGNVWIPNNVHATISEFNNAGVVLSPAGFKSSYMYLPSDITIDGSGNVWVPNISNYDGVNLTNGTVVVEFVGAAAPVVTPLATAVATSTLGTRP